MTIAEEAFAHLLCHPVLPYSNWEWVTVCRSESMAAIKRGMQAALFQLGRVPYWHQTDNSTAATHDLTTGKRGFNDDNRAMVTHFGMKPRRIEVGQGHQNGDVEALNGAFKRRVNQHLIVRGSRDFAAVEEYERWLQEVAHRQWTLSLPFPTRFPVVKRPKLLKRLEVRLVKAVWRWQRREPKRLGFLASGPVESVERWHRWHRWRRGQRWEQNRSPGM